MLTKQIREALRDELEFAEGVDAAKVESLFEKVVSESSAMKAEDLANAICDFADWQWGSYGKVQEPHRTAIGRALWWEVSTRVHLLTGKEPETPPALLEGRSRGGRSADSAGRSSEDRAGSRGGPEDHGQSRVV